MTASSEIRYLKRREINSTHWDTCMDNSKNGLIYGYSFYLDQMARNWDALVMGDYTYIMPLAWNKKWGIRYLYQPPFLQQLGVFSPHNISSEILELFLDKTMRHFRFAEIFLNHQNIPARQLTRVCTNFVLSLQPNYETISSTYKNDLRKNLKKANLSGLNYLTNFDLELALMLYQQSYSERTPHVKPRDYVNFYNLCKGWKPHIVARAVENSEHDLMACALLLFKNGRLYLLASTTLPEGRGQEANHFLLDAIIHEFSGRNILLDFEGSDIPGIAHFYQNFGSINQPYYFYRFNRLPWPLKILKG